MILQSSDHQFSFILSSTIAPLQRIIEYSLCPSQYQIAVIHGRQYYNSQLSQLFNYLVRCLYFLVGIAPFHKMQIRIYLIIFQMVSRIKHIAAVTLCVLFMSLTHAKLEVSNFAEINPSLEDQQLKDIPYSIANFGFAPFGKTMVGTLQLTPGLNTECNIDSAAGFPAQIQNSFLLIPRGDCPFVVKALHAQQMGAKIVIIMDNEDHQRNIIMKDNGHGYKVKIPAIFINYKMGQKLVALLKEGKVTLKISFDSIRAEVAVVTLYMQSLNRMSYYFIEQFKPFYNMIASRISLQVVYDVISCKQCSPDDCYYDGQYCSVSYDHVLSATGKDLLDQQLREQIMFEQHKSEWWSYIECINAECSKISEIKQCSDKCLSKFHFTTKPEVLATELEKSFDYSKDNKLLQKNLENLKTAGIITYPTVAINGIKLKGSLNAEFVFDDICNSLLKPPKECENYISEQQFSVQFKHTYWITIVIVLVLCAILFAALFIFCRRKMRRKMAQEMQGRVDDMVSKYIQFYSERNNNRG